MNEQGTSLRREVCRRVGIPEVHVALAAEKRGELDLGDGTVVEKWLYTAEPGSRIPANLYRPVKIGVSVPAIVLTCGHGGSKSIVHLQVVARTYARAGLVCLLADPLGEEERHPQGRLGTREHDEQWVIEATQAAGRAVMGKLVFDAMRGLDFLESLDWVDNGRLGVAGNSLGGTVAGWLFALEPRLRLTIVSGWAFGDYLCANGKHCTNWPNQQLRELADWPDFLRLGAATSALLVMNGYADVVIDRDQSGIIWRELKEHAQAVETTGGHIQLWWCPGGGHRPYHGSKRALQFINEQLDTPGMMLAEIRTLPELHYGTWCDQHSVALELLYGVELHYRGTRLPDFGFKPIPREQLNVLKPQELGSPDFTTRGWLNTCMGG